VIAIRAIFIEKFFTATSNEKTGNQIEQTAVQRGIKQRWMPDKIVNPGGLQQATQQKKQRQREQQLKKYRGKRQSENDHNRKQTHQFFLITHCTGRSELYPFTFSLHFSGHAPQILAQTGQEPEIRVNSGAYIRDRDCEDTGGIGHHGAADRTRALVRSFHPTCLY
jgi:hypothetical protein